jgi:hypothetical protein
MRHKLVSCDSSAVQVGAVFLHTVIELHEPMSPDQWSDDIAKVKLGMKVPRTDPRHYQVPVTV